MVSQFFQINTTAPIAKINKPIGPVEIVPIADIAPDILPNAATAISIGPPTAATIPTTAPTFVIVSINLGFSSAQSEILPTQLRE
jgi:hypothetical protein